MLYFLFAGLAIMRNKLAWIILLHVLIGLVSFLIFHYFFIIAAVLLSPKFTKLYVIFFLEKKSSVALRCPSQ
jgi:hypothetical protein